MKLIHYLSFFTYILLLPTSGASQERNIQGELQGQIKILYEHKDLVPDYEILIRKYDQIVHGINGYFEDAAQRVSGGYTLIRGNKVIKKHKDISGGIEYYEREAMSLYDEIGRALDSGLGKNVYAGLGEGILLTTGAALLISLLERILSKAACIKAFKFYESARWLSSNEIISGNRQDVNWDLVLGKSCSKHITNYLSRNSAN